MSSVLLVLLRFDIFISWYLFFSCFNRCELGGSVVMGLHKLLDFSGWYSFFALGKMLLKFLWAANVVLILCFSSAFPKLSVVLFTYYRQVLAIFLFFWFALLLVFVVCVLAFCNWASGVGQSFGVIWISGAFCMSFLSEDGMA